MLSNFLKYLYFLIFSIFVFLIFCSYFFQNISLGTNFIFLYSLLIIPVIDIIIEKVKISIKFLLFLSAIIFTYVFVFYVTGYREIIDTTITYSYILLITGAVTQYVSFIVNNINKNLSKNQLLKKKEKGLGDYIHMLYIGIGILFLFGLFNEIIRFVFNDYHFWKLAGIFLVFTLIAITTQKIKFNIKKTLQKQFNGINKTNFLKLRKKLNNNTLFKILTELNIKNDIVFYLIFIFFTSIFFVGYIYNIIPLVILSYCFIFINYVIFKVYGFNINIDLKKSEFKNNWFLGSSIIFTLIFSLSITNLLDSYTLNNYKNFIITIFSLIFLVAFILYFSNIKKIFSKESKIKKDKKIKKYRYKLNYKIGKVISVFLLTTFSIAITYFGYNLYYLYFEYKGNYYEQDQFISDEEYTNNQEDLYEITEDIINDNTKEIEPERFTSADEIDIKEINEQSEIITKKVKIGELYQFNNYLGLENESEDTLKLQEFLLKLGYFKGELNGKFGIYTRNALKYALMYDCHWPKTAMGVLGANAAECIESLEIEVEVDEE